MPAASVHTSAKIVCVTTFTQTRLSTRILHLFLTDQSGLVLLKLEYHAENMNNDNCTAAVFDGSSTKIKRNAGM